MDSVVLFAKALNKIIRDCMTKNEICDIGKLARNGKLITQTIIKMGKYESISGSVVKINKNGDSEGNFTAYALKPHDYLYDKPGSHFTCGRYPVPVCHSFKQTKKCKS